MAEGEGILVTFLDQTGAKSVKAKIAPHVTVGKVIPNIITKMSLPTQTPDGQPLSYSLDHKEGGRRLREDETLPAAGVKDGNHLIVYPEIVAGGVFDDDPRTRRLKADAEAMKRLKESSSILDYQAVGDPPERYIVTFKGKGTIRNSEEMPVELADTHRVEIQLGIDYPRSQPYLRWLTPIYHPNIAVSGAVCLGGYSTNWVPSLTLDRLCEMLWDMLRYANYDVDSPFNYRASQWAKRQSELTFPLDARPLRDRVAATTGDNVIKFSAPPKPAVVSPPASAPRPAPPPRPASPPARPVPARPAPPVRAVSPASRDEVLFIDDDAPASRSPRPRLTPPRPQPGGDDEILFIE